MLGHFEFQVVSGRVGSGIGSFSIRLFQFMSHVGSERVGQISRIGSDSATSSNFHDCVT
jgi:hypothetical protein